MVQDIALLILRIFLGMGFIIHGWPKIKDLKGTANYLQSIKIPFPFVAAFLLAAAEFFGGILVLIGLFAQIAAYLQAFAMLVAIITHIKQGDKFKQGWEVPASYMIIAIAIALLGAGQYSISYYFN
ncbi:MAG: DoxX family protein [Candidatus Woesearchaeota archaeon]